MTTGIAAAACLLLAAAACTAGVGATAPSAPPSPTGGTAASASEDAGALARAACRDVPHEILLRTWRGMRLDRSGDIQLIPKEPHFVSGGLSHAGPSDMTQEVPLLLYGPGFVRPGVYDRPITLADLAPTLGAILKFPFDTADGDPQTQALLPEAERGVPRLVVTVVWDSAGTNVLQRWPNDWPYLRSLSRRGAWFTHVTVGAAPSNTAVGHSILGTGTFPRHSGFVDTFVRVNGRVQKPNENGPGFLLTPTLADLYDRAMGNRPKVAAIATLAAHVMMMSHGAQWGGGDRDIAITREKELGPTAGAEDVRWNLTSDMAPFYRLPSYVNDVPPLAAYLDDLDRADGALDGRWRDHDIARFANGFDTPARTPFQQALIEAVIEREGFGADDVPDLLFVNYKAIDVIGHLFSADGVEMSDAVRVQDETLRRLVTFLDERVGRGEWVLAVTADHGTQRDPAVSGAFMIDINKLQAGLESTFDDDGDGVPLVQKIRPTQIWLDRDELAENGHTLVRVAQWLAGLTQEQTYKNRNLPEPGRERERVFAAVLPSSILDRLPCLSEARASGP
jgi:hypothetical protein